MFRKSGFVMAVMFGVSTLSNAGIINDQLFNTGLDADSSTVATRGGFDSHWLVDGYNAITYKHPAYAANDFDSKWISVNSNGGNETTSSTMYTYATTFDLTGYDASTASISGLWGADNYGSIFLNGNDTGNSLSFGYGAFRRLNQFSIADYFIEGINTLSVELTNGHLNPVYDPGPGALRFDDLELQATAVPEPSPLALFSLGVAGLYFTRRKQNKVS